MKTVRLLLTALMLGGLSAGAVSLQASASPYHQNRLPDGTVTGPISPDAHGG